MARGLNTVFLVGSLTQKAELRYTGAGLAILEVELAGSDDVIGDDGQERSLAWYHRATVFGAFAESMVDVLDTPGTGVLVEGRLNHRTWETPEGQRRSSLNINANRLEVLDVSTRGADPVILDARDQPRLKGALNEVKIVGSLTRDAELRQTPSGHSVTRFSVAVNENFRDRSGQEQERVHFVDVTAWRELAVTCAELSKGDPVFVIGRLVNETWTDREGNRRFSTRLEARRGEVLTRGPGGGGAGTRPQSTQAAGARTSRLDIDEDEQEFPPEEELPF